MSRAWLFVPGHRADRIDKALASGADRVIVDLEDAVAPADKAAARDAVARWLEQSTSPIALRVNAADTPWFEDDLRLVSSPKVCAVVLPKAEEMNIVARVASLRDGFEVVPLIESASGMAKARALAQVPGVSRLAFGHLDLQVDLGMRVAHEDELLPFRLEIVLASRMARLAAPLDGVTADFAGAEPLATDVARARRLGFGGKLCIHPKQVGAVKDGFAPSADELAWARRVVDAMRQANGAAVAVDGKMVDKPVLLRAEAILRDAQA